MEFDTKNCSQPFDVVTGVTEPEPSYTLTVLPNADEKACAVVKVRVRSYSMN